MGSRKVMNNPGYSHLIENLEVPNFQHDIRLERRWKRMCISNEMIRHKYHANATRKNMGNCDNAALNWIKKSVHMVEEEVDEDYKSFLDNFVFHTNVVCGNNVGGSDIDVNTSLDSNSDDDDMDAHYKIFLENLREDVNSYIFEVFADNQLFYVKYEGHEGERLHDSVNSEVQCGSVDEDYRLFLNSSRMEGEGLVYMPERAISTSGGGNGSEEKSSMVRQNLQVPSVATEPPNTRLGSHYYPVAKHKWDSEVFSDIVDQDYQRVLNSVIRQNLEEMSSMVGQNLQIPKEATDSSKIRQGSDDYHLAKHKCDSGVLSDIVDEDYQLFLNSMVWQNSEEQSSMVGQNLQVPKEATKPLNIVRGSDVYHVAKHTCDSEVLRDDVDEDYQIFLNSVCRVGDSLMYTPENGVTEVYEDENDQSSATSEPIVLDPNQYYENSPFICSKSYHSSWLEDERNHTDSMLFYAFEPSPYRKGLMEELERPYDQKEYERLLQEASCRRPKEHHRETRRGVTKSCPLIGVNKSNLEMYSDLAKAIDQVNDPHKVLFLLRGFFYWLKHLPQEGAFRPWLDASCLEILRKM